MASLYLRIFILIFIVVILSTECNGYLDDMNRLTLTKDYQSLLTLNKDS